MKPNSTYLRECIEKTRKNKALQGENISYKLGNKAIQKYLEHYIEPCVYQLHPWSQSLTLPYSQAVVIPLFKETGPISSIWKTATKAFHSRHPSQGKILVILVFNAPTDANQIAVATTQTALYQLNQQRDCTFNTGPFAVSEHPHYTLLTLDFIRPGICGKQGVGYARKLGADVACWLFSHQKIKNSFLSCTDADVQLPEDYFEPLPEMTEEYSAFIHRFTHIPDEATKRATHRSQHQQHHQHLYHPLYCEIAHSYYELYLRHLVANLALSRSPYAYHTIGSLLKVNLLSYAQVRGFPKRAAAEDFYLLNKLAKVGKIQELTSTPIRILPRTSDRTPFGTGPQVTQLLAFSPEARHNVYGVSAYGLSGIELDSVKSASDYIEFLKSKPYFYPPNGFELLEKLLTTVEQYGKEKEIKAILSRLAIPEALYQSVSLGLSKCSEISKSQESYVKHFNQWFDGFRTMKWLNLSAKYFPKVTMDQAFSQSWLVKNHAHASHFTKFKMNNIEINHILSKLEKHRIQLQSQLEY